MKKIKNPPIKSKLTQYKIDRPEPKRDEFLDWIDGVPGLIFTIVLLAIFVAGMWGLWALWSMINPLSTAIKG